ncbi:O-antigen polysaccharide polymerase Wzy [Pedobacter cryoconitis]|uniref:Oligosaccharide repeat unit polymerase n=1 Tax=Pedobacter cryoconitis TaxID=188932 RepID=A0A7X0J799_9SPHI|nr:O-antigen polysaccharide polymerase Wzy [Pedobacter cryoconitis]MBB6502408.1 oligosaccharide repeat unit polymerase [Pedobacter cryoconitis]
MSLRVSQLFCLILLIEAIVVYFAAPKIYNYNFNVFCSVQYAISVGIYLFLKKKKNYFDFDCVFFTGYFFVTLFYPVFMYENDPTRFFAFQYDFDANIIPQASALALVGINAYIFGSFLHKPKSSEARKYGLKDFIPNNHLSFITAVTFLLYILTGGYAALGGAYSGDEVQKSAISSYVFIFTPAFLLSTIIIEFYNLRTKNMFKFQFKNLNKITLFISLMFVFLMLATGSRTVPMQVILLCGGLLTLFFKPISFVRFVFLAFLGMGVMFLVVLARGYQQQGNFSLVDIAMDLIINNRNSYAAIEYVRTNGITWGMSMSASFLSPVPFLQNIVITLFGIDPFTMSSSIVITKMTLGEVGELGLGTNIIADIYMSFGFPGVVLLMTGLGYFISMTLDKAKTNIYALVCYGIMMSYAVFLVRAEFFFFLRFLVWGIIIVYISKLYRVKFVLRKKIE